MESAVTHFISGSGSGTEFEADVCDNTVSNYSHLSDAMGSEESDTTGCSSNKGSEGSQCKFQENEEVKFAHFDVWATVLNARTFGNTMWASVHGFVQYAFCASSHGNYQF